MRLPDITPDAPPDPSDRLNGWKEIAAFLGKGVRTAQRWERELGLPVHRLGRDRGEIVFALKSEVQRWTLTSRTTGGAAENDQAPGLAADSAGRDESPEPPATPTALAVSPLRGRLTPVLAAGVALATFAIAIGAWRTSQSSPATIARGDGRGRPASFHVDEDTLHVVDTRGARLWSHRFLTGLDESKYVSRGQRDDRVAIEDFDADGDREVAFISETPGPEGLVLTVFNADGTVRFIHRRDATVHYRGVAYRPHWRAYKLVVTRDSAGTPLLWLISIHDHEFPTLLEQIDGSGQTVSEYWSNGYIDVVASGTRRGRPVVLVGATNNEHRGASLAVFDGGVQGSAPAANDAYRCADCPAGRPTEFIVFPRTCVARHIDGQPWLQAARTVGDGGIVALVGHGRATLSNKSFPADAYYTLAPDLRPERVDVTRQFLLVHEELQRLGHIDHAFGAQDERDLQPLLRWDGARFVSLPVAPVTR
jgi:hypothetical protein